MSNQDDTARRIVVGVDGSESSAMALRWGAWLARMSRAPLQVVMAWDYPTAYGWSPGVDGWDPEADAKIVIDQTVSDAFGSQAPALTRLVKRGGAAAVIVEMSRPQDVVVLGSRGHGGFMGLLLGSVSAAVAEHSPCPVLIIHGDQIPPEWSLGLSASSAALSGSGSAEHVPVRG